MLQLVCANNKGGVGKTTLSVHLAAGFARAGKRTLLVDLDAQSQSTHWLNSSVSEEATTEAALVKGDVPWLAPVTDRENLFMLHASESLAIVDTKLSGEVGWHTLLKTAIESHSDCLDVVVYDAPPNLGMSVVAAFYAADAIIAPVAPAFLSIVGLNGLHEVVGKVNDRLGGHVQVLGHVLFGSDNRDGRTKMARDVLLERYQDKVFDSEIRFSSKAASLPAKKQLAWDAKADPRGAHDYDRLVQETIARLSGEYRTRMQRLTEAA